MNNYRNSIGQLLANDRPVATAWLIDVDLAVTALHCLTDMDEDAELKIRFPSLVVGCTLSQRAEETDFALLQLEQATTLEPLKILDRPIEPVTGMDWYGHGYPSGLDSYSVNNEGLSLNGSVDNIFAELKGISSLQLTCLQSTNIRTKPNSSVLGGVSGSPIFVSFHGQDFVIGFIREQPPDFGENVIFATAIDLIKSPVLPKTVHHHSWDSFRGVPVIRRTDDGILHSNIDANVISQVWEHGLSGFWCNVRPDECDTLANAVERVLVHSRSVSTRSKSRLRLSGCSGWEAACKKYLKDWMPLSCFSPSDGVRHFQFEEIDGDLAPQAGASFQSVQELADHIQFVCNNWVLAHLRDRFVQVFSDPENYLDFTIASDILSEMKRIWRLWLGELGNDRCLLHHFLGLMQTGDGNFNMSESGAGVGPLTLDRCVARPIAYTLALCTGLPSTLQLPKAVRPGNVGIAGLEGHACGIEVLKGRSLNSVGRTHQWRTAVVMLPYLQDEWPAFEDAHQRLDVAATERSQSLSKEPPGPVVLPKDRELQAAIETGLPELRRVLQIRCQQLNDEQANYVNRAANDQR